MVYQHSVFPTVCELSGVPAPKTVEFPSLVDLLHGRSAEKHDAMFCFYRDFQRSVRTRRHKLIVYPQAKQTQLFDLEKDPWETRNLAEDAAHKSLRQDLQGRLQRLQKELGDTVSV